MGLVFLFARYFSLFRLFMVLLFIAGTVVSALGGIFLAIPFEAAFSPWIGAAVGITAWCVATLFGWRHRAEPYISFPSCPRS